MLDYIGRHRWCLPWIFIAVGAAGVSAILVTFIVIRAAESGLARLGLVPVVILLAIALFALTGYREPAVDESREEIAVEPSTSWVIAAGIWSLVAPAWVALLFFASPPDLTWVRSNYLDKRWLIGLYWSSWGAVAILPSLIAAVLGNLKAKTGIMPVNAREEMVKPAGSSSAGRRWAAALTVALLASALFGPPWHTDGSRTVIGRHETVHWSGLQGIHAGYPPYIGPASNNYGPGMQLATYAYMKLTDQFSVPGFRETNGVAAWVALVLLGAFAAYHAGIIVGLLAVALSLFLSPLYLWTWESSGALQGFFGWANALRQVGPTLIALSICGLVSEPGARLRDALLAAGIGLLWGMCAYYSQENFMAGAMVLGVMLVLCVATGTLNMRRLGPVLCGLLAGSGAVALAVIGTYSVRGLAGEFWANYSLVPARFLRGYANTAWAGSISSDKFGVAYYTLPFLVTMLAALALYRFRPLRFAIELDRPRLLMVGMAVAFLSSFSGAMLRSDYYHLVATFFPLTILLPLALLELPRLLTADGIRGALIRALIVLLVVLIFLPVWSEAPSRLQRFMTGRGNSLKRLAADSAPFAPRDEVERRIGFALSKSKRYQKTLKLVREVKRSVGQEPVFVYTDGSIGLEWEDQGFSYAGHTYFLADLNPGPILMERTDMVADNVQLNDFLRHFEDNAKSFGAVVSSMEESEEMRLFREAHPAARVRVVEAGGGHLYILREWPGQEDSGGPVDGVSKN